MKKMYKKSFSRFTFVSEKNLLNTKIIDNNYRIVLLIYVKNA